MDTLTKIKQLLGMDVKLAQVKLENGAVLEAEAFEEGQSVFIVSDEERIPLPVGEYQLEDGQKLAVIEEGIIAAIGIKEEEPVEEEMEVEAEVEKPKKIVESTETHFSFSAEQIDEIAKKVAAILSEEVEEITPEVETKEEGGDALIGAPEVETKEVEPQELSVELSEVKPKTHSPEKSTKTETVRFARKRRSSIKDRVFEKLFSDN